MRFHPVLKEMRAHLGTDFAASTGTPARTVGDGVVTFSGVQNGYGNVVFIKHRGNTETVYAHLSKLLVRQGDSVSQGQTIGLVGATGWATGPHLHFEVRANGVQQDPMKLAQQSETIPVAAHGQARIRARGTANQSRLRSRGRHTNHQRAIDLSRAGHPVAELFIGLMSGTSLDGVDGVLVDFSATPFSVRAHASAALAPALKAELLALNLPGNNELHRAALAANALMRVYAEVVAQLLSGASVLPVTDHRHRRPRTNGAAPTTAIRWQRLHPAVGQPGTAGRTYTN